MRSREQKFAATIYTQVNNRHGADPKSTAAEEYGSMAHKLPILIRTAGLVQALTFLQSRGKESQKLLLEDLAEVVLNSNATTLVQQSRDADLRNYMALTERTLTALKWYKRFAQSVLGVDATAGEDSK